MNYLDTNTYWIGNLFYLETGTTGSIVSNTNTYENCYSTNSGAIFYLPPGTSLTDSSSSFTHNAANLGGNIWCDSCTISLTSTIFKEALAESGSVLYILNTGSATFN